VPWVRIVAFRKNQVGNFCLSFQVLTSLCLYEQGATSREHAATASGTAAGAQPPLVMA
jgi:hypothetical protein